MDHPAFKHEFGPDVQEFKIDVDKQFIEDTKRKVALARLSLPESVGDDTPISFQDGPKPSFARGLKEYWANEYDWFAVQDRLINTFKHFSVTLKLPAAVVDEYKGLQPQPIHFIHHTSPSPTAVPLLFLHGWPGSFMEATHILEPLTNPPSGHPAFHIVAPSLPGFGFSPLPKNGSIGPRFGAHIFHALMQKLGYKRYIVQGGDFGGITLRYLTVLYPDSIIGAHSNFFPVSLTQQEIDENRPTGDDADAIKTYDASVSACVAESTGFFNHFFNYGICHSQAPLRLAYSLTDSPLGLACWIWGLVGPGVTHPEQWTYERIITWTMMLYIPGPYGGFQWYREGMKDGAFGEEAKVKGTGGLSWGNPGFMRCPTAVSRFPADLGSAVPEWAVKRRANLKRFFVHDKGGHFPAYEDPEMLVEDIRQFLQTLKAEGLDK